MKEPQKVLTSLLFCLSSGALADDVSIQYLPEYMPQAPTAQAIAHAIDIPVNYYTGIPNISIPIYNIQLGNLSVPITLSYQGGGIRPSQEATSVGLGWSLSAGGAITRTVKCADDFMEHQVPTSQFIYGFLERQDWPDNSVTFDYNYYHRVNFTGTDDWYCYLFVDSEPDIFFYSIPRHSGKFSFKKDRSVVYFDKSDNIKISPSPGSSSPYFYAVDNQGTAYSFEAKERTHVYSVPTGNHVNTTATGADIIAIGSNCTEVSDYTSTWYLTRMVSATNDTIDFEYEDESYLMPLQESCRYIERISGSSLYQEGNGPVVNATKTTVESKRITKIKWRGGYVLFQYGAARQDLVYGSGMPGGAPKSLTSILVFNANNLLISHWQFNYDYFSYMPSGVPSNRTHLFKRLRLTSVKNMLTEQAPYTFTYDNSVQMPVKNTKNLDYWGYYNGTSQGEDYYCQPSGWGLKAANAEYAQMGILKAVSHPTGGHTKLYWESNKIGEVITSGTSNNNTNHDSYSRGCLIARKNANSETDRTKTKAVLLNEPTEIYLLFSSKYTGSQSTPQSGGTPFSIKKINSNGTATLCHTWSVPTVGDEFESTVTLTPGVYEFKCSAIVNDVEYSMFFIDSINKRKITKMLSDTLFCYNSTEPESGPSSDARTFTLQHSNVVFLSSSMYAADVTIPVDSTQTSPFRLFRRKTDGTYETLHTWTVAEGEESDFRSFCLPAGNYKVSCDAVIDEVLYFLTCSYGDIQYTPFNVDDYESLSAWTTHVLCGYGDNIVDDPSIEEESDTVVVEVPTCFYIDGIYLNPDGPTTLDESTSIFPFRIYKQTPQGTFSELFRIPVSCFSNGDGFPYDAMGIYLDAGTYVFSCSSPSDDYLFIGEILHKNNGTTISDGSKRGGLRIARIEGEKDVTYLYEGGKDMIPACRYYKESHVYSDATVVYGVRPSESIRPLTSLKNGNIIGYSKVVEIFADSSRNEYSYYNEEEELEDPDFAYSPTYTDWNNGLLQTTVCFNAAGDTVSVTSNSYNQILTTENYLTGFMEVRPGCNHYYYNTVFCPKLNHSTYTEYRGNGKYTTRKSYLYNADIVCKEENVQVGSDIHKTIYKYAGDFSDTTSQLMTECHMVGIPVAKLLSRNGVIYGGTRSVYGDFNELTDNGNTFIRGQNNCGLSDYSELILPTHLLTVNTSNMAGSFQTCLFDTTVVYSQYTRFGKPREIWYKGMPITYLWSYKGLYPIAEMKNVTYQQFKTHYNVSLDMSNAVCFDPDYYRDCIWLTVGNVSDAETTIAFYTPLVGATEIVSPQGVCHSYSYDQAGRLSWAYLSNVLLPSSERQMSLSYGLNTYTQNSYYDTGNNDYVTTRQYYDEWGRPSVSAAQGAKQDGTFSYGMQTYDLLGRPFRTYVTVPSNSTSGAELSAQEFTALSAVAFSGDSYGYVQTNYDAMGRTAVTTIPGQAWNSHGKTTSFEYLTNSDGEVKRYGVSGNSLVPLGYYAAGTLDCTLTTDPDDITLRSYKDVFGNVVLERRAGSLDTYYVYDNCNRLRFVLPPKYQDEPNLGYYAYQYEYDGRGRMVKKTLPGCAPVSYWYDSRDRLIRMQDGLLAQTGCYRVWTYDGIGRQTSQAIYQSGNLHHYETRSFYDGYNFVDTYSSLLPAGISNVLPANDYYTRGQLTGFWQQASNGETLLSVMGYNEWGLLAKKTDVGLNRNLSISDFTYNLGGNVTAEDFRQYTRMSNGTMELTASGTLENKYDYPHTNLLTSSVMTIYDKNNNMRRDTISNLTYDDFGRVMHNSRGGTVADMTYSHDKMHGWLTGIRSGGSFEQNLYRETEGSSPCYNGNISAMTWRTGNDYVRRFDYGYDSMNRLIRADYSYYSIGSPSSLSPTLSLVPYVGMENEDYSSQYGYDKNGNLLWAYRQGLVDGLEYGQGYYYDTMDDYNVTYAGNRKTAVNGTGCGTPAFYGSSSFVDGVEDGTDEYAYNTNGAMTKDLNKGITNISYDLLGNLQQITMTGNRSISYVYAADGTRLRTVHSRKVGGTYLKDSTDYSGSLVLKNALPDKYLFDGGYLSFSNSLLSGCHYYIRDYQGSNRMVVNADGTVEQVTHYYPYGGVIGGIDRNASLQAYKFEGKELDRTYGLDWYDIHARQYDPVVPSWHTMDPLCEKYYNISPYAYCAGNPVNAQDIHGDSIIVDDGIGNSVNYDIDMKNSGKGGFCDNVCSLLNDLASNTNGRKVVERLTKSHISYSFTNNKPSGKGVIAAFSDDRHTIELGNLNTLSFAEETFHAYQYDNGERGMTVNREVDAKLFSALVNQIIEGWDIINFFHSIAGIAGSTYDNSTDRLLNNGFNMLDYSRAINSFLKEALVGPDYQKLGYKVVPINNNPLIKRFLK